MAAGKKGLLSSVQTRAPGDTQKNDDDDDRPTDHHHDSTSRRTIVGKGGERWKILYIGCPAET